MEGIRIRKMSHSDVFAVHSIAQKCFSTPWQVSSFTYELNNCDAILYVAAMKNEVLGYVCLRTMLDITHVMDIAVLPSFRRSGIGTMMLCHALQKLRRSRQDIHAVSLEVRESNIAAVRLYEKIGFRETGRRKSYYKNPVEDALIMELDMHAGPAPSTLH